LWGKEIFKVMNKARKGVLWQTAILLVFLTIVAGCAGLEKQSGQPVTPQPHAGAAQGYLTADELPDSLAIVPAPPSADSKAFALDLEIDKKSMALRNTARWTLAAEDANLNFPQAAESFSCSLGVPITEQDTPRLYTLLRRTLRDAILSTHPAKNWYKRIRPFVANGEPTCAPGDEARLSVEGSYPSGHSSVGWSFALILCELAPERADAILARGRAFGQSRVICNVHWQSDVIEGRFMGAATVARLHAVPEFRADLEAAKTEIEATRAKGLLPARDCAAEAEALSLYPPDAPWPADK
jgi:acid phosphatase (class A)